MSNDPASGGEQPGWQGQQPYPGGYGQHGQHGDQGYPQSYPPPGQQGGYGQAPPPWAQQSAAQPGGRGQGGYPGSHGAPAGLAPGGPGPNDANGTFAALFDFGFNSFATPVVIKVLYILGLVVIGLGYVGFVITAFLSSAGYGLLMLVFGGLVALFYVIFFRVFLEFYYAVVRMSEDIRAMRSRP